MGEQNTPVEGAVPVEETTPMEPAAPVEQAVPMEQAAPVEPAAPVEQIAPVEPTALMEPVVPVEPAAAADPSVIDQLSGWLGDVGGVVWGPWVLIPLLLGAGVFLTVGLRFVPWTKMVPAFLVMWHGRKPRPGHEGELTPFKALMTSMAATVGTGNIVGVATAILLGGPGAVFWMWMTALFGMGTKFCEATLAVKYREVTPNGSYVGGPMYYIKNGLGPKYKNFAAVLAVLFAVFGMVASFGIGNLTQANAITANVIPRLGDDLAQWQYAEWSVAFVLLILAGVILIGGVRRIGNVAGTLVPIMAFIYVIGGLIILALHLDKVPGAFGLIFGNAFTVPSATGGLVGVGIMYAIRFGVARGLFSNEAGLGSAPIAHATAIVKNPVRQGMLGMLDPFLDTIVVCTISALVILVAGDWAVREVMTGAGPELRWVGAIGGEAISSAMNKAAGTLTATAFNQALPGGFGAWLVTIGLVLFAFSTILGWCVYGERCVIFLFGHKAALPFRVIFTLVVPVGALAELELVWNLSDLFNGLMAIPNLIALLLLSPVVFKLAREFFADPKNIVNAD